MTSQSEMFKMQWGKYKGRMLKDTPVQYIRWLATNYSSNDKGLTTRIAQEYLINMKDQYIADAKPFEMKEQQCLLCREFIDGLGFMLMMRLPRTNKIFFAHEECINRL